VAGFCGAFHGAFQIFAEIDEAEELVEDASLHIVGEAMASGGDMAQALAVIANELGNLIVALGGGAGSGFAAHGGTIAVEPNEVVVHAHRAIEERGGHLQLAALHLAGSHRNSGPALSG